MRSGGKRPTGAAIETAQQSLAGGIRGEPDALPRAAQEAVDAYERSRTGGLFFVAVWVLICVTAGENGWREWAIGCVFIALAAARLAVGWFMRRHPQAHERHLAATLAVMILTMAAWGSVTAFTLVNPDFAETPTVILFATSAFTTAFVHNYPMRLPAVVAGLSAGYAPAGIFLVLSQRPGALAIAIGVAIHYAYLLLAARRSHYEYHRNIDLENELRAQRDQFDRRSRIDALTGLANRRELNETLAAAVTDASRAQQPLTLVMFDLDHFKAVNDERGHAAGDGCLVAFAQRLAQAFSGSHELAARLGGEEFAAVLRGSAQTHARERAEAFRANIARIAQPPGANIMPVTVSIGIGQFDPAQHADADALYRAVDAAMYRAKHAGRNRVVAIDDPRLENEAQVRSLPRVTGAR